MATVQKSKDRKDTSGYPQYVQRMLEEGKGLRARIYALSGYLNGNSSQGLSGEKRVLMAKQIEAMQLYSDILTARVTEEERDL